MQLVLFAQVYRGLTGWLDFHRHLGVTEDFNEGLIVGASLVLVVVLLVWLIRHLLRRRTLCEGIKIPGEKGDLFITVNAVYEFVRRIMHEFSEASLQSVNIRQGKNGLSMNVEVAVIPDTDLVPLRDRLQSRIVSDSQKKMGIDMPLRVNVAVRSMEADERKIARKSRRLQAGGREAADAATSEKTEEEDEPSIF